MIPEWVVKGMSVLIMKDPQNTEGHTIIHIFLFVFLMYEVLRGIFNVKI